jgi:trimeric autotransporter adhesin
VKNLKRHLSVANVLALVALFVALGGAAVATTTLSRKSVKTRHLAKGAVTTKKLRNGAVTAAKIRNGAVIGEKLAPGAVGSTQILNGAVRSGDLGGGVVTSGKLKDGAVTDEKLANGAVTNSKLGADAVSTGKIQDGAVTASKLSPTLSAQLVKGVSYVNASSPSNDEDKPKSITAQCPAGKQVTGGGARVVGAEVATVALTESAPFANAESKRTGWTASAAEIAPEAKAWAVEAYAVCAEL